jgi:hypothetical protein
MKQVASRARLHVPPKRQLMFNGLHGVISQKLELFVQGELLRSTIEEEVQNMEWEDWPMTGSCGGISCCPVPVLGVT